MTSISSELEKLKTGARDLRKFGLTVGAVLVLLSLVFFFRNKPSYVFLLGPGVALIALGTLAPRALKYVYIAWMALAFALGFIMSQVILILFSFLFVTPIGLLARLVRKDFLARRLDKQAATYWIPCANETKTMESYERQF